MMMTKGAVISLVLINTLGGFGKDQAYFALHHDNLRGGNEIDTYQRALKTKPTRKPTHPPSKKPSKTPKPTVNPACMTLSLYDAIDADIASLKNNISDIKSRIRFLGGIVRLAAHDFMDYDQNNPSKPMGPDGCFDATHPVNAGISDNILCADCPLTLLHKRKYSHVSKADFWIAAANAVIRQTSNNNALDMKSVFQWGRKDAVSCSGAGDRLPNPSGCTSVENVFLTRMGLSWKDAAVLMGAHTLGRSDIEISGHDGIWKDTEVDAQRFDKQYYDEIFTNSWRPRNSELPNQDWTTGFATDDNTRMMLNTDLCLVFEIEQNMPCCTRTDTMDSDGDDTTCIDDIAAQKTCPLLNNTNARYEAYLTILQILGDTTDASFYNLFIDSWNKATTVGLSNLFPLKETCP